MCIYANIYTLIFCCFLMCFSCLTYIFMHQLPLTGETFEKSWCSLTFRSSKYMSIIMYCFLYEKKKRRISLPVVFSVPGFSHQVSSSLRFMHLFLDFVRKKSVEFLKIQKANCFFTISQSLFSRYLVRFSTFLVLSWVGF